MTRTWLNDEYTGHLGPAPLAQLNDLEAQITATATSSTAVTVNATTKVVTPQVSATVANTGLIVGAATDKLGFIGTAGVSKQAVTGALTTVSDAPAKAVLTALITALVNYGLLTNSTT